MNHGFYTIITAQFFSSLADNALLIAAIAILVDMHSPAWMTPFLKLFFVLSYVFLAAFVGAFADAFPKGRVMLVTNLIKISGCILMFFAVHPLFAYAIVGFGAAAYSPAKYGILTELLPPEKLIAANGWLEGLTVSSIIFGTVLGGLLVNPDFISIILVPNFSFLNFSIQTPTEAALCIITIIYIIATIFNLNIPNTGAQYPQQQYNPIKLIIDFSHCFIILWKDKIGQISLAVTTLFWGAGATLQFIVLKWAEKSLYLPLDKAAILQGIVALGVALGAIGAARFVPLKKSFTVMPLGITMGIIVIIMAAVNSIWIAYIFLILVGVLSGYFVVPMNALLQYRGHILMSAGHSIAVQNFNENLSVLMMLLFYALMVKLNLDVHIVITIYGTFVATVMYIIMRLHTANERKNNSLFLIDKNHNH